jgi:cytidine deaminase
MPTAILQCVANFDLKKERNMSPHQEILLAAARQAQARAYAPYSNFNVGAALLTASGAVFCGCNVENASYGLTCCAERNAIFAMIAAGETQIREILIIGDTGEFLPPCGACRQVMVEFADPSALVHMCNQEGESRTTTVSELVPFIFHLKS